MADHLSQERLLRYLDDELSISASRKAAEHLGSCEKCAVEFNRLKGHLAVISEADVELLGTVPPPPLPWPRIEPRLDTVASGNAVRLWQRLVSSLEIALKAPLAYGSTALIFVLIALLIWRPPQPVSAKEVLQRATAADGARLAITQRQVVRQRVRVKETSRLSSDEHTAQLEAWKSTKSTYWDSDADPLNAELLNRYKAFGLGALLPLSPPALRSWVALAGSEPTASSRAGKIDVRVASNPDARARGLEEFSFQVQTRHWHVNEITLSFEDARFQIDEEVSTVLDRSEVPRAVMAHLEPPEPARTTAPTTRAASPARALAAAVNLNDLEMTVRYALHGIGADLGENIEISPHVPDQLVVSAGGASPRVKEELAVLLANKPGVRLELEVGGANTTSSRVTAIPHTMARPPDQRLMSFFGDAAAEENFTRSALQSSTGILAHLYALRELTNRWPPEQEERLSVAARAQFATMLRDHAHDIQIGVSQLQPQMDFFLKGFGYQATGSIPGMAGTAWRDASASGLVAARGVDHILRSLLTTSDTPVSLDDALPELRQNMQNLDRSASELLASVP
jgi:hypothetical protein